MQRILQEPFGDHCQWWAPVELVRRTLFIIFIAIDPGNLVCIYSFVCTYINSYTTVVNSYMYTGSSSVANNDLCSSIYILSTISEMAHQCTRDYYTSRSVTTTNDGS